MQTQTTGMATTEMLQEKLLRMPELSKESLQKLAEYIEELIEEDEEAEDKACIDALTSEDYANAVPFEEVIKEFEAEHGPLYKD